MPNVGIWGIVIIVLVVLLLFGPKRLPQIGRSAGRGMREFKETVTDHTKELKEATAVVPSEFKDGLNPLKSEDKKTEEVIVTATPQAVVNTPAAAPPTQPPPAAPAEAAPPVAETPAGSQS